MQYNATLHYSATVLVWESGIYMASTVAEYKLNMATFTQSQLGPIKKRLVYHPRPPPFSHPPQKKIYFLF
jgi:hypothetical protein